MKWYYSIYWSTCNNWKVSFSLNFRLFLTFADFLRKWYFLICLLTCCFDIYVLVPLCTLNKLSLMNVWEVVQFFFFVSPLLNHGLRNKNTNSYITYNLEMLCVYVFESNFWNKFSPAYFCGWTFVHVLNGICGMIRNAFWKSLFNDIFFLAVHTMVLSEGKSQLFKSKYCVNRNNHAFFVYS